MFKYIVVAVILGICAILKLVITGACLAIGFKGGYYVYDKAEAYIRKTKIVTLPPEAVAV